MSGGSREPDRPPRAEDGSGNTVVIENRLEKSREARRHAIDLHRQRERLLPCGHVPGPRFSLLRTAYRSKYRGVSFRQVAAGLATHCARHDNVSHLSIP